MTAFDRAWDVLKDFYFNPNEPNQAGIARMTRGGVQTERGKQTAGGANTRYLDHEDFLQGRGQRRSGGAHTALDGTWNPANRKREPNPFIGQELKRMPVRQAGQTDFTAGVNLSSVQSRKSTLGMFGSIKEQNEAFNRFVYGGGEGANENARFNEFAEDGAAGTLAHEYGHGLMNDELSETHESGFWGNAADARAKLDRAHEIGAYSLQTPGGPSDELVAQRRVQQHPDANKVPLVPGHTGEMWNGATQQWEKPRTQIPRVPRPAYAQNAEGWEGGLEWEQNYIDELQTKPGFKSKTRQVVDRKFAEENPGVQGRLRPGL